MNFVRRLIRRGWHTRALDVGDNTYIDQVAVTMGAPEPIAGEVELPDQGVAVPMSATSVPLAGQMVYLQADPLNPGNVYPGDENVDDSGFMLVPGESMAVIVGDLEDLYLVGDEDACTVRFFAS